MGISGVSLEMSGIFADFALAEENMDERFGLVGEEAVDEEFLLDLASFFEWHFCGGFNGFDGSNRSKQTALLLGSRFTRGGKDRRIVRRVSELFVALTRLGSGLAGDFACKLNRSGEEIAFDDAVDDAELQRFVRFHRIAAHAHFDGFCHASKPRNRWVPAAPGIRPSFTSGWPTWALETATR